MFYLSDTLTICFRYKLVAHVKTVHWDCPWDTEEDSNLLKGIYEYGMGSWESIKMDPDLNLYEKVQFSYTCFLRKMFAKSEKF